MASIHMVLTSKASAYVPLYNLEHGHGIDMDHEIRRGGTLLRDVRVTARRAGCKNYEDLSVLFFFGDDDGLDRSEFSAPEHLKIQPKVGPFMRFMQGMQVAEYVQLYSVKYPVVVSVWDDSLGRAFKFS